MAKAKATTQILITSVAAKTLLALAEQHCVERSKLLHDLVLWLDLTQEGQDAFALFARMDELRSVSAPPPMVD